MRHSSQKSIAVGFFDGVHLGHQAILACADAALTFTNHPLTVLDPKKAPKLLQSPEQRVARMKSFMRKRIVSALTFTPEIAAMSAEDFARRVFFPASHPEGLRVICSENWHFGAGGKGNADLLERMGLDVQVIPPVYVGPHMVSSTRIRELLANGDIAGSAAMLGQKYRLVGHAFKGKGVGKELGFPTINYETNDTPLKPGVYKVLCNKKQGIAYVGRAPTFGRKAWRRPVVEVHFLNPHKSLDFMYNPNFFALITFQEFIREECKFKSLDDLKAQLAIDVAKVRTMVESGR